MTRSCERVMVVALCVLAAAAAGCARRPAARARATRAVVDAIGRTLVVPVEVRRVVSLAPSTTECLFAVGAGDLVVAVDGFSDFPPEVASREKLGDNMRPNVERIVTLQPDVVFLSRSANSLELLGTLERMGIPGYVSAGDRLDEIAADLQRIADLVGRHDEGVRVAGSIRARGEAVRARRAAGRRVKALVVVWPEPFTVAGAGSHVDAMLGIAGGENVAGDSDRPYPVYSIERILRAAPEVIVVGAHTRKEDAAAVTTLSHYPSLPAVRDGRVQVLDGNLLFRPGPRMPDAIEALERALHGPPAAR